MGSAMGLFDMQQAMFIMQNQENLCSNTATTTHQHMTINHTCDKFTVGVHNVGLKRVCFMMSEIAHKLFIVIQQLQSFQGFVDFLHRASSMFTTSFVELFEFNLFLLSCALHSNKDLG